jgi:hypothetical protein
MMAGLGATLLVRAIMQSKFMPQTRPLIPHFNQPRIEVDWLIAYGDYSATITVNNTDYLIYLELIEINGSYPQDDVARLSISFDAYDPHCQMFGVGSVLVHKQSGLVFHGDWSIGFSFGARKVRVQNLPILDLRESPCGEMRFKTVQKMLRVDCEGD